MKLHKKILINYNLKLLSGLHIGDSKDNVEIGGVDNPVVRRKDNNEPYIPGSSIKGKLRSLVEIASGKINTAKNDESTIASLFGSIDNKITKIKGRPSRLIVRDAYLTRVMSNGFIVGGSAFDLKESEYTDMPYTEIKFENTIDRLTGTTINGGIRQQERIPAGAEFDINFVVNIITEDGDKSKAQEMELKYMELLFQAIELLEKDYLGGSGSRGYGQVKFENKKIESKEY